MVQNRSALIREIQFQEALRDQFKKDKLSEIKFTDKQKLFINSNAKETCLSGANKVCGKTTALLAIATYHLSGNYPGWFTGPRYDVPVRMGLGGDTVERTRDILTDRLLGTYEDRGTGYLPFDSVHKDLINVVGAGVKHAIESFRVKHKSGGFSTCKVFSYAKGWTAMRSYEWDFCLIDEEPVSGDGNTQQGWLIYDQLLARIMLGGYMYVSLTPEHGLSKLWEEYSNGQGGKVLIPYTIDDCLHIPVDKRNQIKEEYRDHPLLMARLYGQPVWGENFVYGISDNKLIVDDKPTPKEWKYIIGLDFPHTRGTFAASKWAIDPVADRNHLVASYKQADCERPVHAAAVRAMGGSIIPCAWPKDNLFTGGGTGEQLAKAYQDLGLKMLPEPAFMIGMGGKKTDSTRAIIEDCIELMATDRLKVFRSVTDFFKEKWTYRMKEGSPMKNQGCDLIDSMHKAMMMRRFAQPLDMAERSVTMKNAQFDFFKL